LGLIGVADPDTFEDNVRDSLLRMGHRVSHLGSARVNRGSRRAIRISALGLAALPELENKFHHRLVRKALDLECDAVITVDGDLSPYAISALRQNRVPVALWFPDAITNMGRQRMLSAPYTALFFKDPLLVERLRDILGLPVWYLPEACNPSWHRPIGAAATERVIVMVGNSYPSRLILLRRLHDVGVPLVIYGSPVPQWAKELLPASLHTGRHIVRDDKSRVFRSAAGVLNNLHPAEMHGVNCRLFEAAAAGAAVLCERRPVLSDLFDLNREVIPFGNFDELVDRARELLADPALTRETGDAASKRAHAEHTYEKRLNTILEKLT
jgi:spore maturation protein CgeB